MKKLIIPALLIISLIFNACTSSKTGSNSTSFNLDTTTVNKGGAFYVCPMHPKIISGKPGSCPDCGMPLEKKIKS